MADYVFPALIRKMRERYGLQQKELAHMIGVGDPWLSKIEAAKHNVNERAIARIAAALGMTTEAFLREGLSLVEGP